MYTFEVRSVPSNIQPESNRSGLWDQVNRELKLKVLNDQPPEFYQAVMENLSPWLWDQGAFLHSCGEKLPDLTVMENLSPWLWDQGAFLVEKSSLISQSWRTFLHDCEIRERFSTAVGKIEHVELLVACKTCFWLALGMPFALEFWNYDWQPFALEFETKMVSPLPWNLRLWLSVLCPGIWNYDCQPFGRFKLTKENTTGLH